MHKLLIVYLISSTMFINLHFFQKKSLNFFHTQVKKQQSNTWATTRKATFLDRLDPELVEIGTSFILGNKKKIPKEIKKTYQQFSLGHLFAPSGLHLSSIILLITFPFLLLKRRPPAIISISICIFVLLFLGIPSLKRVALLKIFLYGLPFLFAIENYFHIFLITFLIDFLYGTFIFSPLSFAYSFLFLGTIFSVQQCSKIQFFLALQGCQFIISYCLDSQVFIQGLCFNFLLSSLFTFIFPIVFFSFLFNFPVLFQISTLTFHTVVLKIATFFPKIGGIYISFPIYLAILLFCIPRFRKKRILLFSLILHNSNLNYGPRFLFSKSFNNKKIEKFKPPGIPKKITIIRKGHKLIYGEKNYCILQLKAGHYRQNCFRKVPKNQ